MRDSLTNNSPRAACLAVLFLSLAGLGFVGAHGRMEQGNRAYRERQYERAGEIYSNLAVDLPNSPHVQHNLGLAYYGGRKWHEAGAAFRKGLERAAGGKRIEGSLAYNLGVTHYRQAMAGEVPAAERKALLQASLDAFKRAILADSRDMDAKYDYELVKRLLKQLEDEDGAGDKEDDAGEQGQDGDKDNKRAKDDGNGQEQEPGEGRQDQDKRTGPQEQRDGEVTPAQAEAILEQAEGLERFAVLAPQEDQPVAKDW
ncbi:MAG: hypothetical protein ACM3ZC_00410 [Bacteroidota bacterium]